MKVFIDTNIFLDILCRREQFVDDALSIFDMAVDDRIELLISDLSIANIKYITRSHGDRCLGIPRCPRDYGFLFS